MFDAIRPTLHDGIELREVHVHINERRFADAVAETSLAPWASVLPQPAAAAPPGSAEMDGGAS